LNYENIWETFWTKYNDETFPNLVKLYNFSKILPITTVLLECGFSIQNKINTKQPGTLKSTSVDISMEIILSEFTYEDFDFNDAFTFYFDVKDRRIIKNNK